MESLLLNRSLGKISNRKFEQLYTESLYFQLSALDYPKFPSNKSISSINSLDIEKTDYEYLLSGSADSSIKLWNIGSKKAQLITEVNKNNGGHKFGITCVKWWPHDNGMFLSSSYDSNLKVWDSTNFEEAYNFELGSKINCFDINENIGNSLISTGCESSHVRILDLKTTSSIHTLIGHNGIITSCKWNPNDSNLLATGSSEGEIRIWDIRKTNSCLTQLDLYRTDKSIKINSTNESRKIGIFKNSNLKAHSKSVNGLIWMENGKSLISTGNDEKIRVWNLDIKGGLNTLLNFGPFVKNKFPSYKNMILSSNYETEVQYLWYPSDNGEILVFRIQDGKLVSRLRRNIKENSRSCCITYAGHNTGKYYSGTVDGKIRVWGPKEEDVFEENGSGNYGF